MTRKAASRIASGALVNEAHALRGSSADGMKAFMAVLAKIEGFVGKYPTALNRCQARTAPVTMSPAA
jgi:hypothetical protein